MFHPNPLEKPLTIIIFDGSLAPSTFVYRLALGLSEKHKVAIMGFSGKRNSSHGNLQYVHLGSASNTLGLLFSSAYWSWKSLFKRGNGNAVIQLIKNTVHFRKKALQQQNLNLALGLLNPDIVHVQWPSLLPWCESLLEEKKYKVVLSQRGYQVNIRAMVDVQNLEYLRQWYPKIDGFHSVSKAISRVGDRIWENSKKVDAIVYSGFNFDELPYQESYKSQNPLRLLSVGRPHWIKGYPYALEACSILKKNKINFQYQIIGAKGDEELLVLIDCLGLSDCVFLLHKINQNEVYQTMKSSSILLFPSLSEGLPNVVVEAMALGLPVIATQCGGVAELLDAHGESMVPVRDAQAMAHAVMDFLEQPDATILKQKEAARLKVERQHSMSSMIEGMENLYRKCLTDR